MRNDFVSYEIAKRLKELGFDEECFAYKIASSKDDAIYFELGGCINSDSQMVSTPTYSQVVDWFEKKGIYFNINVELYSYGVNYCAGLNWYLPKEEWKYYPNGGIKRLDDGTGEYGDNNEFPTRESAVIFLIEKAIKKLEDEQQHKLE